MADLVTKLLVDRWIGQEIIGYRRKKGCCGLSPRNAIISSQSRPRAGNNYKQKNELTLMWKNVLPFLHD